MPGPWDQAPGGLALSDRPLEFSSNATAVALVVGRSCEYARLPWTPDSFRRLTPRVSGPCGGDAKSWGLMALGDGLVFMDAQQCEPS